MKISAINNNQKPQNFNGYNVGKLLSRAANISNLEQRATIGVAAMVLQPTIDMLNKDVDKETRKVSANRSLAKGFIGTLTGIIVRGGCMKLVESGLKTEKATNKLAEITAKDNTPEALEKAKDFIKNHDGAKKYASVIGTIVALGVMIYTNFAVDAPLTNWLTDVLNKKTGVKPNDNPTSKIQTPDNKEVSK